MREQDVRYFQDRGLVQRPRRQPGRSGDVTYTQEHLDRLKFISRALIYGFSLEAITRLVDMTGLTTCGDIYQMASSELERLESLLGPASVSTVALRELMTRCTKTGGRADCPIYSVLSGGPAPHAPR